MIGELSTFSDPHLSCLFLAFLGGVGGGRSSMIPVTSRQMVDRRVGASETRHLVSGAHGQEL